jgi:hypothetical protein
MIFKRFEYSVMALPTSETPGEAVARMNAVGLNGWQLVCVVDGGPLAQVKAWFVRELPEVDRVPTA